MKKIALIIALAIALAPAAAGTEATYHSAQVSIA